MLRLRLQPQNGIEGGAEDASDEDPCHAGLIAAFRTRDDGPAAAARGHGVCGGDSHRASGVALLGMLLFREPATAGRIVFIGRIVIGIVGCG